MGKFNLYNWVMPRKGNAQVSGFQRQKEGGQSFKRLTVMPDLRSSGSFLGEWTSVRNMWKDTDVNPKMRQPGTAFPALGHKPNFFLGEFRVSGMEQGPSCHSGGKRMLISESGWCSRKSVSYFQVGKVCLKKEAPGR